MMKPFNNSVRPEGIIKEEFLKLQEELACYDDLRLLRDAKKEEQKAPSVSFEEAKNILNIE